MSNLTGVELLKSVGFEPAGEWTLDNGRPAPVLQGPTRRRGALYAFVAGDEVLYIGKPTWSDGTDVGPLGQTATRATGAEGKRMIDILFSGREVAIWMLAPQERMEYRGLPLDIAAGLEPALIERVRPTWNGPAAPREKPGTPL